MGHSLEIRFAADHPTAAGHFPGNPIIPGAVLLDEVLAAIAAAEGGRTGPVRVRSAKFLHPVRPGEAVQLHWEPGAGGEMKFECRLPDSTKLVLTGTVQWQVGTP